MGTGVKAGSVTAGVVCAGGVTAGAGSNVGFGAGSGGATAHAGTKRIENMDTRRINTISKCFIFISFILPLLPIIVFPYDH